MKDTVFDTQFGLQCRAMSENTITYLRLDQRTVSTENYHPGSAPRTSYKNFRICSDHLQFAILMRYLWEFSVRRLRYAEPIMVLGWQVHHLFRLFTLTHQYMTDLVGVYSLPSWCTHKPTPPYYKMPKRFFKKQIRNTWKVLKCCGGGHRKSVGQIMWKLKHYSKLNSYTQ